jgi:hypothetical protein
MRDYLRQVVPSMLLLILVAVLAAAAGCGTMNSAPSKSDLKEENIVYFKDSRTGICYAALNSASTDGFSSTTITYVPCTPEVEKLIK